MIIKKAKAEDFDELKIFYVRMNEIINSRNNGYNPDNAVFPTDEMINKAIASEGQIIGIEDGRIVAGCIVSGEGEPAYNTAKWNVDAKDNEIWILHALRVAPEYEGRGFAKQMLSYVIDIAPKRNRKAIRLDVLEGYSVENLYLSFGFKYIDTVEILYDDIGYPRNFRLLERKI